MGCTHVIHGGGGGGAFIFCAGVLVGLLVEIDAVLLWKPHPGVVVAGPRFLVLVSAEVQLK